jgi:small basic protein
MRYLRITVSNTRPRFPWWASVAFPSLALGWIVGLFVMPGPEDRLVQYLSLLAMALGPTLFVWFNAVPDLRTKYPPAVMIGGPLCILLSGICLWREFSPVVLVRLSMPLGFAAILAFYISYFSMYWGHERVSRLQLGDRFPDFALPDSEGRVVTLASLMAGGPALMLFYKGDW